MPTTVVDGTVNYLRMVNELDALGPGDYVCDSGSEPNCVAWYLLGATVTARSLDPNLPYEETVTTAIPEGKRVPIYQLLNAPIGARIQITASRPGLTTRRIIAVVKPNPEGDPTINRLDFGKAQTQEPYLTGNYEYHLYSVPEVTGVQPEPETEAAPNTALTLSFSEPMDTASVESAFQIRKEMSQNLSVGATLQGACGDIVWDASAFDISWNSDDTEATFTFKDGNQMPTDKDPERIPEYRVVLIKPYSYPPGNIQDKAGNTELVNGQPFFDEELAANPVPSNQNIFFTETNMIPVYRSFSRVYAVRPDQQPPELSSIVVQSAEGGNPNGDGIRLVFSEIMRLVTSSNATVSSPELLNPAHYFVSVNGGAEFPWSDHGAVVLDDTDPTRKTVILYLTDPATKLWGLGDEVTVRVGEAVTDPAGNGVNTADNKDRQTQISD